MLIKPDTPLDLNPSPKTRPRKSGISGWKCLLITGSIVLLPGIGLLLVGFVSKVVSNVSNPHRALYQNLSLHEVSNRTSVVQPLINHEQTFDIAATVWVRSTGSREHEIFPRGEGEGKSTSVELMETPLYSDVIFRGLDLRRKTALATINFTLPTDIFYSPNLSNFDLRASIMLLPSSPSLLDHVTNYSTWIPDGINPLPVRSWPFPLGADGQPKKTLADKALESFGVSAPLIRFHSVRSQCHSSNKGLHEAGTEESPSDDEEDNDVDEDAWSEPDLDPNMNPLARVVALERTNGKSVLQNHPYIITRTRFAVVDEVRLFNRKAYNKAQKHLKNNACGRWIPGVQPNRYSCYRTYDKNGHWETSLQVNVRNESTGHYHTEWAYAPYISVSGLPQGRTLNMKDLLEIPINREKCFGENDTAETNKTLPYVARGLGFINVTWQIQYARRSPSRLLMSQFLSGISPDPDTFFNIRDRTIFQDGAELAHNLVGERFSGDAHPQRRAVIHLIRFILSITVLILDIRYWYTRRSTVSISILGTALISGSELYVKLESFFVKQKLREFSVPRFIASLLLIASTSLVLPLLMIKAILHIEFRWWKGTTLFPIMQRGAATHRERASERLEAAMSWYARAALLLTVSILYYTLMPNEGYVIPSLLPDPVRNDSRPAGVSPIAINVLYITGTLLQFYHNLQSRFFAGGYKLSVFLMLLVEAGGLVEFTPSLVGKFYAENGLPAHDIVQTILLLVAAWQAFTLPDVPQSSDDDDEDAE